MTSSNIISLISLGISIISLLITWWYTRKEFKESKLDTGIAKKSDDKSEESNRISQRSNKIAKDSIDESTKRDRKKIAIKAAHVFYESIEPEIRETDRSIDQFIINHSLFKNKLNINIYHITPKNRLFVQMHLSSKYLQQIINIIIDINDWAIDINSGMADMEIITEFLRPMLYNIFIEGYLAAELMNSVDKQNYNKLMDSFHFKF